jgi:hypothetical protein
MAKESIGTREPVNPRAEAGRPIEAGALYY